MTTTIDRGETAKSVEVAADRGRADLAKLTSGGEARRDHPREVMAAMTGGGTTHRRAPQTAIALLQTPASSTRSISGLIATTLRTVMVMISKAHPRGHISKNVRISESG